MIFTHYELADEGEQTREINRYFEAGTAALHLSAVVINF